jgi:hypothetical protein
MMMRDTPRTFIGTVAFRFEEPPRASASQFVEGLVNDLPGVSLCDYDEGAGLVLVTASEPVERADVLALLRRLGCRVVS